MTTEADGGCRVRRNDPPSGSTMCTRAALHALHGLDCARNLALEGANPGDLLHERGQADGPKLVEQLVAGVGAARQALFGEQHARLRRLLGANHDLRAFRIHVEGDAGLFQGRADPADVLGD